MYRGMRLMLQQDDGVSYVGHNFECTKLSFLEQYIVYKVLCTVQEFSSSATSII